MKIIKTDLPHSGNFSRRSDTTAIVLHHAQASNASVETINEWHLLRGWNGIGYHYYIRKDGSVYQGRPEWALGAHAQGANDYSIGVCCEGSYMTETMPEVQLRSLKALLRDMMGRYGELKLLRHKNVCPTDCHGNNFPWAEVQKYKEDKEDMFTYEQFKEFAERLEKERAASPVSAWARDAWGKLTDDGVTDGTRPQDPLTREQYAVMQQRQGFLGK